MDFKKIITTLSIVSMILLFVQCENEEIEIKKEFQPIDEVSQDPHAKKGGNPGKPDGEIVEEYATITGDVTGIGCYVHGETPFTLTITEYFNHDGIVEAGTFEGTIRIMYSTKKRGENRIDFWYTADGVDKFFHIRQANPNNAYDPETRTMTLVNADALIAIRDGTGETYWEFTASATVVLEDCD